MRITSSQKVKPESVKIDFPKIRKVLKASGSTPTMLKRQIAFIRKVVQPQVKEKRVILDLSNDKDNGEKLGLTPRQAKRVKQSLSDAKIVFVPDWGRQKKKGEYPAWLLNFDYSIPTWAQEETKKRKSVADLYDSVFLNLYENAKREAKMFFLDVEDSMNMNMNEENFDELEVDVVDFMIVVNRIIGRELEELGKKRADFKV